MLQVDVSMLLEADRDGDAAVNMYEFAVFMLKAMDKVDDETIEVLPVNILELG